MCIWIHILQVKCYHIYTVTQWNDPWRQHLTRLQLMGIVITNAQKNDMKWFITRKLRRKTQFDRDGDGYKLKNKTRRGYKNRHKSRSEVEKLEDEMSDIESVEALENIEEDIDECDDIEMRCKTCNHNKCRCKHEIDELLSPQSLPTSIQHEEEEKEDGYATE